MSKRKAAKYAVYQREGRCNVLVGCYQTEAMAQAHALRLIAEATANPHVLFPALAAFSRRVTGTARELAELAEVAK